MLCLRYHISAARIPFDFLTHLISIKNEISKKLTADIGEALPGRGVAKHAPERQTDAVELPQILDVRPAADHLGAQAAARNTRVLELLQRRLVQRKSGQVRKSVGEFFKLSQVGHL